MPVVLTGFQPSGFQNNGFEIATGSSGPGSGSSSQRRFPDHGFGFVGDSKPAELRRKSFRPIWDRAQDDAKVEQPKPAPRVIQPPPQSLFAQPQRAPLNVSTLPNFNQFVPPNLVEMGRQMRDSQDMSDALAALQAVLAKNKLQ
jgi:hypothetical protein